MDIVSLFFLGKWMEDHGSSHWALGLPSVIFRINTRTTHTTRKTPYQLVFGQNPRTNAHYWQSVHDAAMDRDVIINDLVIDKITHSDANVTIEKSELVLVVDNSASCLGNVT